MHTDVTKSVVELCEFRTCVPRMVRVLDLIGRFATLETPVLIEGETGTGKELAARALHAVSNRASKPMVVIDCASLPESILESELFGHERGAFTGADRPYGGRIQSADGGTVFLDEVNSISLGTQGKLLRFLDQREFCRVGQSRPVTVDVRLISATNVSLEELVATGRMRPDFFYRLNVLRIELPPLRDRLDDIPFLVEKFLAEDPVPRRFSVTRVAEGVLAHLRMLSWPGNVRELYNILRRAVALAAEDGVLWRLPHLPVIRETPVASLDDDRPLLISSFRAWMREREREYLTDLVKRYRSVTQQATASGLPQRTLYRKIRRHGLRGATSEGELSSGLAFGDRAPTAHLLRQ